MLLIPNTTVNCAITYTKVCGSSCNEEEGYLKKKRGPAHLNDILRRAPQLGWRTRSAWLLDCCDEEAGGRSNPHRPLTSNDVYRSSVVHGYK